MDAISTNGLALDGFPLLEFLFVRCSLVFLDNEDLDTYISLIFSCSLVLVIRGSLVFSYSLALEIRCIAKVTLGYCPRIISLVC